MQPIAILASGMVTSVGLNAEASCAAVRCAVDNFSETRFMDKDGEWIIGSQVLLEHPLRGLKKLVHMVAQAIKQCLAQAANVKPETIPLLLCVAEKDRPGRLQGIDTQLFEEIQNELGVRFHPSSEVIPRGRVGGAVAVGIARRLVIQERSRLCLIAGVDSLLVAPTLAAFEAKHRLLTSKNSNGFIPGEAGAAIVVGPSENAKNPEFLCLGIGSGQETATIDSEHPLRADGLVQAISSAFVDAQRGFEDIDYRLTDANGEQYWFKEAALAMTRLLRVRKEHLYLWHAADCIGETGAAAAPIALGLALAAARKNYAPGPGVLCHFGDDHGERVAMVMGSGERRHR
jgi:3-oxoacyl-[acyl-carrier-protein] synthase I